MTALALEAAGEALPEGWVWCSREELARDYAVPNAFRAFEAVVDKYLR